MKPSTWQEFQRSAERAIGGMSDDQAREAVTIAETIDKLTDDASNVAVMSALILVATHFARRCAAENDLAPDVTCHGLGHVLHDSLMTFAPTANIGDDFFDGPAKCIH